MTVDALAGLEDVVEQLSGDLGNGKRFKGRDKDLIMTLQTLLGYTAIAQQASRIANTLESIDSHLADLLAEYRDRDWKGIR